jgi:hypothetical protein
MRFKLLTSTFFLLLGGVEMMYTRTLPTKHISYAASYSPNTSLQRRRATRTMIAKTRNASGCGGLGAVSPDSRFLHRKSHGMDGAAATGPVDHSRSYGVLLWERNVAYLIRLIMIEWRYCFSVYWTTSCIHLHRSSSTAKGSNKAPAIYCEYKRLLYFNTDAALQRLICVKSRFSS